MADAGVANGVTVVQIYSTADRRRQPILSPSVFRAGRCGSRAVGRVTDDCGAPATSAMWPAVLHGRRPRYEASGQLTAFGPGCYAGASAEAK